MSGELLFQAARAAAKAATASRDRDEAIRAAVRAGHSLREVATASGLSYQRIHQLAHSDPALTR